MKAHFMDGPAAGKVWDVKDDTECLLYMEEQTQAFVSVVSPGAMKPPPIYCYERRSNGSNEFILRSTW